VPPSLRFTRGDFRPERLQLRDDLRFFLQFREDVKVTVNVGPVEFICALSDKDSAHIVPVDSAGSEGFHDDQVFGRAEADLCSFFERDFL
jgi:hypothetical protein